MCIVILQVQPSLIGFEFVLAREISITVQTLLTYQKWKLPLEHSKSTRYRRFSWLKSSHTSPSHFDTLSLLKCLSRRDGSRPRFDFLKVFQILKRMIQVAHQSNWQRLRHFEEFEVGCPLRCHLESRLYEQRMCTFQSSIEYRGRTVNCRLFSENF